MQIYSPFPVQMKRHYQLFVAGVADDAPFCLCSPPHQPSERFLFSIVFELVLVPVVLPQSMMGPFVALLLLFLSSNRPKQVQASEHEKVWKKRRTRRHCISGKDSHRPPDQFVWKATPTTTADGGRP